MTDKVIESGLYRIWRAFEGETELMISCLPSSFCTDGGRAIGNAGAPPINKPGNEELAAQADSPEWLATLPGGVRKVFQFWKTNLKPGGFSFSSRSSIIPVGCQVMWAYSSGGQSVPWNSDSRLFE